MNINIKNFVKSKENTFFGYDKERETTKITSKKFNEIEANTFILINKKNVKRYKENKKNQEIKKIELTKSYKDFMNDFFKNFDKNINSELQIFFNIQERKKINVAKKKALLKCQTEKEIIKISNMFDKILKKLPANKTLKYFSVESFKYFVNLNVTTLQEYQKLTHKNKLMFWNVLHETIFYKQFKN